MIIEAINGLIFLLSQHEFSSDFFALLDFPDYTIILWSGLVFLPRKPLVNDTIKNASTGPALVTRMRIVFRDDPFVKNHLTPSAV
ncbi:MAG: hypothetical protein EBV23_07910 [Flavobacteriia bacterium]|nr:hypothetical protein [Flavobacteriia bacterium]